MNQKVLKRFIGKSVRVPFNGSFLDGRITAVHEKWLELSDCEQDGNRAAGKFLIGMPEWIQVIE